MQLRRSARAEQDLIEIWNFIAGDNEAAADKVFDLLVAKSELIARNPALGAVGRSWETTFAAPWPAPGPSSTECMRITWKFFATSICDAVRPKSCSAPALL